MLNHIFMIYNYLNFFIGISLFTYIYKYCLNTCNEKVLIKTKHNKTKSTIKPRIGLAFAYLFFVGLLYYTVTIRVILTVLCLIGIGTLYALDKFDKNTINRLCVYDKNKIVRIMWKIFYSVINIMFLVCTPIHNFISENLNSMYKSANQKKNAMSNPIFGALDLNNFVGNGLDLSSNIKKAIHELTSDSPKGNVEPSSMSDYVVKTEKTKTEKKIAGNQKAIIEETYSDLDDNIEIKKKSVLNPDEKIILNKILEDSKTVEMEEENKNLISSENNKVQNNKNIMDEEIKIENTNINKKEETEKLLELFKKMNDIFSSEEKSSTTNLIDNTEATEATEATEPNEPTDISDPTELSEPDTENNTIEVSSS